MAEDSDRTPAATGADTRDVGAVLLGGGSRRMGHDKASLVLDGTRLVDRAVTAVRTAVDGQHPVLVVGQPHQGTSPSAAVAHDLPTGSRWVSDLRPDAGPLAGLEAALTAASDLGAEVLLLAGVDHPWLCPAVLRSLSERVATSGRQGAAAVLDTATGPLLLLGAYRTTALPTVRGLLDAGERRLQALLHHLDVEVVEESVWRALDPLGATAVDVDDPATLTAATRWHRRALATAGEVDDDRVEPVPRRVLEVRPREATSAGSGDHGVRTRFVAHEREDIAAPEAPLRIRVRGPGQDPTAVTTLLRSPGHDRELAVGWLFGAGFIAPTDLVSTVAEVTTDAGVATTTVTVEVRHAVDGGVACGTAAPMDAAEHEDAGTPLPIPWSVVTALAGQLRWSTAAGAGTDAGTGIHRAGLFDVAGRPLTVRSDISRHNVLDAVIGAQILAGEWPVRGPDDVLCALSGRVGARLIRTAASARIPVLVAVGSASALAVATAERAGITLVGSLRGDRGTVYTHPERLCLER